VGVQVLKIYPAVIAAIVAGILSIGGALVAYPASDNTASTGTYIHKAAEKNPKECVKCHKAPSREK
jgi:hypothetical protein